MRLIDADELKKALAEMWYENAISISGISVSELIDKAPTIDPNELELDIDYSIEYDKRPDGISNAKVTITRIKPRNIIACKKADELDMLERMYAEPCKSADQNVADVPSEKTIVNDCDLISREDAIETVQSYLNILIDSRRHGDDVTLINVLTDIRNKISALPSADRPTDGSCQDCPIYSAEEKNCPRFNKVIPQTRAEMEADRPKGEWRWTHGGQCSECGFHNTNFDFNFCPNCGADMRKDADR